jgi:predicted AAA+ superfamily ATPase
MMDLLLLRRLMPWHQNVGKRLVRSPKVYVRDSGVLHALLGLAGKEELLSHAVVGQSWEGFVLENILAVAPERSEASFYRASGGAEIDLVLTLPAHKPWAVEIKRSLDPRPAKGFHHACADVEPEARYVVYPGSERFSVSEDVEAIGLAGLARAVCTASSALGS